jgi:cell division protein FtsX
VIDIVPKLTRWAGWAVLAMIAMAVITVPLDAVAVAICRRHDRWGVGHQPLEIAKGMLAIGSSR